MFLDANGELSPGTVGLLVLAFTLQFTSAQCTDRHKQQADFGGIICIRSGTRRCLSFGAYIRSGHHRSTEGR